MSVFTVYTDTGRAFALTNEADAVRVALALVREGHTKHARARASPAAGPITQTAGAFLTAGTAATNTAHIRATYREPAAGLTP